MKKIRVIVATSFLFSLVVLKSYSQESNRRVVLFLYDTTKKDFSIYKPRQGDSANFKSEHMIVAPRKGKFRIALKGFDRMKYIGKIESIKPVNFKTGLPASLTALVGTADPFTPTVFSMPPTTIKPRELTGEIKLIEQRIDILSQLKDDYNVKMDSFRNLSEQGKWDYSDFIDSQNEFISKANQEFGDSSFHFGTKFPEKYLIKPKYDLWTTSKTTKKLSTTQLEGLVALQADRIKELTAEINALKALAVQYTPLINHADQIVAQLDVIDKLSAYYKSLVEIAAKNEDILVRETAVVAQIDDIAKLLSIKALSSTSPTAFKKAFKKAIDKLQGELTSNQDLLKLELQGNIISNESFQIAIAQINRRYDYFISDIDNFKKMISNITHWSNSMGGYVSQETQNTKASDVVRVKFSVSSATNKADTVTRIMNVSTRNGIDVDFSTGLIYNTIFKQGYNIRFKFTDPANPTTAERYIDKEDTWRGDVAISAFVNFSFRTRIGTLPLRTGLSPGLGLSIIDGGTRYFIGWHLYFGQQSMLGLVGGLAYGKTIRLASSVSDNGIDPNPGRVAYNGTGLSSVPTYEQFISGGFVGLVWNLSRK